MALFYIQLNMRNNKLIKVSKKAYAVLIRKNPLQMSGATAFFATFALPCILLILVQTIGLFYNPDNLQQGIFAQLADVLGSGGSEKVYRIFSGFRKAEYNWIIGGGGFIFMLFVVTTLFNVVRNSVNELWNIKVKPNAGAAFYFKLRIKSLIVIFFAGIILTIQLLASALHGLLKDYITELWGGSHSFLNRLISQLIFAIISTGWFTVLFKYLANAHPNWKTALTGGIFTGILFTIGKILIGLLLSVSVLEPIFGEAGSFVLVLLFVFYSSFIFYYGAAFTKAWNDESRMKMLLEEDVYIYNVKQAD